MFVALPALSRRLLIRLKPVTGNAYVYVLVAKYQLAPGGVFSLPDALMPRCLYLNN